MQMTRLELYELVCDRPLSRIAPDLDITGTALAAICKQHEIPYPGSGYWTRKNLGLPVELIALQGSPDVIVEIVPAAAKPRAKRTAARTVRKPRSAAKPIPSARHPLLIGVEKHYRKTRRTTSDEFLRPYKRILPDLVSSEAALTRALSLGNDIFLALGKKGYRVEIAQAADCFDRIPIPEQEVERRSPHLGHYHATGIWAPDRPTVFRLDAVPIGLALTEMTRRVTMRYLAGSYHREDSKLVRSAHPWQLTHSWTTEKDLPCGRFRLVAYSPKRGVIWSRSWQETEKQSFGVLIPKIVETLGNSKDEVQRLMDAADVEAERRRKEWEEQRERYARQEDARRAAQALADGQQQLTEIIEAWGRAMTVERFFADATERLMTAVPEQRQRLEERLLRARAMMGNVDPLNSLADWVAPEERYRSKFG